MLANLRLRLYTLALQPLKPRRLPPLLQPKCFGMRPMQHWLNSSNLYQQLQH
jgi:hypothetical protein